MKTSKTLINTLLVLAISGIFAGCKKDDSKANRPTCRVHTETIVGTGPTLRFSYNSDSKVTRVVGANGLVLAYTYDGNVTTVLTLDSGAFSSRAIITNNAAGLAINVRMEYDDAGTNWSNTKYEYNGEELIKSTNTNSSGSAPTTSTYSWSNGNLVTETSASGVTTYDYYTDKPKQNGDYFTFVESISGYEIVRNKNLLKSISPNVLLTYEIGPDGRVSTLKLSSGSSVNFIDFEYECI